LLLDENRQLKQEMAIQQITINNLSQVVEYIRGIKVSCPNILSTKPSSQSTPPHVMTAEISLKE
jgi:hypothetical protein